MGHIPFLVVWKPNVPVTPATLFVNKAAIESDQHGELTWGAAQAGVAHGVTEYAAQRFTELGQSDAFVLLTAVWVDPKRMTPRRFIATIMSQHSRLYSKARRCPNNRWPFVNIWRAVSQAIRISRRTSRRVRNLRGSSARTHLLCACALPSLRAFVRFPLALGVSRRAE